MEEVVRKSLMLIFAAPLVLTAAARADTQPRTMREAIIMCEQNQDAREADATGKHALLSVEACARRIIDSYPTNATKREARHWNRTHECVCGSGTPDTPACLKIPQPCKKDDCCSLSEERKVK
jgi:hypothetical protein